MYILSDGKNYVMENPMKIGEYLSTTSPVHAKEFSYKQARALIQSNRKKWAWIKQYHLIGTDEEGIQLKILLIIEERQIHIMILRNLT